MRNAVNDRQKQSIDNTYKEKKIGGSYNAWDRTCAAMDRLEDTILYLNSMELGKEGKNRSAFDFYDFINNAFIVIDCIKTIGHIFKIDEKYIAEIEKSTSIFGNKLGDDCTDQRFFEYIRSLCSVHPLFTNRQKEFLNGSKFHCCPFVTWKSSLIFRDADLTAFIYTSNPNEKTLYLDLYVSQFEQYLAKWIDLIPKVIEAKNKYAEKEYEKLRKEPVKYLSQFNNDISEYLEYLKDEYCKRFDYGNDYIFDEYKKIFTITLSDSRNNILLEKYQNAILYSLSYLRNGLQNMSFDGFDNTGIKHSEEWLETTLFDELYILSSYGSKFSQYSYNLEKLYYLCSDHYDEYDKNYARILLEELKGLLNQYVYFTNKEPDEEAVVLVSLAQYIESLSRKCLLNINIPNEIKYRTQILTDEELENLFLPEKKNENQAELTEDFLKILKEYGG